MTKLLAICVLCLPVLAHAQSVTAFEPSASELPANTLRFYFTFDRPARGQVHQSDVKLTDSNGKPIDNVFMDFGSELWSPDGKRLTVLFDPGKVKRGVEAPLSERSPLQEHESYKIVLGTFQHAFHVTAAVRTRVAPSSWTLPSVTAGSRVITIEFDRVMDAALLEDQLQIEDEARSAIPCVIHVIDGGRGVQLMPSKPLGSGRYRILIGALIEDVAGNRMNEALDHSVTEAPGEVRAAELWATIL